MVTIKTTQSVRIIMVTITSNKERSNRDKLTSKQGLELGL